jgi:hypothetical protein
VTTKYRLFAPIKFRVDAPATAMRLLGKFKYLASLLDIEGVYDISVVESLLSIPETDETLAKLRRRA